MKYSVSIEADVHMLEIDAKSEPWQILWDGKTLPFDFASLTSDPDAMTFMLGGKFFECRIARSEPFTEITLDNKVFQVLCTRQITNKARGIDGKQPFETLKAPMPGMIAALCKQTGDRVEKGEPLLILEAMKMENELRSPVSGRVNEIRVSDGQNVNKGEVLITVESVR